MNDFERRLHGALRDAAADPLVPGALLTEASRRATVIRRRRVATRSAVGAAAVVATGAVVARPAAPGPVVAASASASPSASVSAPAAPAANVLRITITRVPCVTERASSAGCVRTEVDVEDGGLTVGVEDYALEANVEAEWQPPRTVGLTFKDGTAATVPTRQVSESRWVAELPGRTKDEIATLSVPGGGETVKLDRVPAQETPAAG